MSEAWGERPTFRLLDALVEAEIAQARALVGDHPAHRLYLEAGLAAARQGADRTILIGRGGRGLILGIRFDRIGVRTAVGTLAEDELLALGDIRGAAELHLADDQAEFLARALSHRVAARRILRLYRLDGPPALPPDPRCRLLGSEDFRAVEDFFGRHNAGAIFSRWMLALPFLGWFEAEQLVACGGVVAQADGLAHLGNFLTRPDRRGRGLGRAVAATLAARLMAEGNRTLTLAADADNPAAGRAYEALGFRCFETRSRLDLDAAASGV
ncbi:MAG TPA: GNAT family N-acetyltransferase [Aliidongia sp.]|nr:GNAT family N-acetyltransferase [Aliidongia sp.]